MWGATATSEMNFQPTVELIPRGAVVSEFCNPSHLTWRIERIVQGSRSRGSHRRLMVVCRACQACALDNQGRHAEVYHGDLRETIGKCRQEPRRSISNSDKNGLQEPPRASNKVFVSHILLTECCENTSSSFFTVIQGRHIFDQRISSAQRGDRMRPQASVRVLRRPGVRRLSPILGIGQEFQNLIQTSQ